MQILPGLAYDRIEMLSHLSHKTGFNFIISFINLNIKAIWLLTVTVRGACSDEIESGRNPFN